MKFLEKNKFFKRVYLNYSETIVNKIYNNEDEDSFFNQIFLKSDYIKKHAKKRKILLKIKKGLTKTEKKNSLKRDVNNTILQQLLNLMIKKGDKNVMFKHLEKSVEMFFFTLNDDNEEFLKYKNYTALHYLINNVTDYSDFSFILEQFIPKYYSIFDIKTKKNNKKSRSLKKYSHEITYVPENKRLKNTLKVINMYSKNFKNYELWERLFWMFVSLVNDKKNSYILKRRLYIYKKSIRFFITKKTT